MSKRENHWYLVGTVFEAMGRALRPRGWVVALSVLLTFAMVVGIQTGALDAFVRAAASPAFDLAFAGALAVVAIGTGVGVGLARRSRLRSAYVEALASPHPEPLLEVVVRTARMMRNLPDGDALAAQSRALAWALYGRGADAKRALAEVSWGSRAPLIRAVGLSAEAVTEALCGTDVPRALEQARRARAMASVSARVPGAAQTARYHDTCVGLPETILGLETPATVAALEESAADSRYPPLQLIASFGLALALERSGDAERAERLRVLLRRTAPHCATLHATAESLSTRGSAPGAGGAAGEPASSIVDATTERPQRMAALRKLWIGAGVLVGAWALLLLAFAVLRWLFAPPG
jgi:hypothetical protein